MNINQISLEDSKDFFNLIENNRNNFLRYFPVTINAITNFQSALKFIEDKVEKAKQKQGYYFAIRKEQKLVGIIILKDIDWNIPKSEIAYYLDKDEEGSGIMSKAIEWLVKYSFEELKLNKIYARINPTNIGSKKVIQKNGFEKEGTLKFDFRNGENLLTDSEYYGILNPNGK